MYMYNNKIFKGMHYGCLKCARSMKKLVSHCLKSLSKFHDFSRSIFSKSMIFSGFWGFFQIPWYFQVWKKVFSFSRFPWFFQRLETLVHVQCILNLGDRGLKHRNRGMGSSPTHSSFCSSKQPLPQNVTKIWQFFSWNQCDMGKADKIIQVVWVCTITKHTYHA